MKILNNISYTVLALAISSSTYASDLNTSDTQDGDDARAAVFSTPELVAEIFSHLSLGDQLEARATSKSFNAAAHDKIRLGLKPLFSHKDAASPEDVTKAKELSRSSPLGAKILEAEKEKYVAPHKKSFDERGYTFVTKDAHFKATLNKEFIAKEKGRVASLFDLYEGEQETLIEKFFPGQEPTDFNKAVIQHLLSQIRFYLSKDISAKQLNSLKEELLESAILKNISAQNHYVAFEDLKDDVKSQDLMGKTAHIVVTATEMLDDENKKRLEALIEENPDHTLVLVADASVVNNGKLNLTTGQIPSNLRHLVISDVNKSVTSIGERFLSGRTLPLNCTTLDMSGLSALKSIESQFIFKAENLTTLILSDLANLENIGDRFLCGAINLSNLDFLGLSALKSIGKDFHSCPMNPSSITTVDFSSLINLKNIGLDLFFNAPNLDEVLVNSKHLGDLMQESNEGRIPVRVVK